MTDFATQTDMLVQAALIAGHLLLGTLVGIAHFATLRRGTDLIVEARTGRAILLMVLRLALTGGVLAATSLEGAVPLLVTSAGLMLGRAAVLRREGRRVER